MGPMSAYVALLRGVNLGPSHRVPMAELRTLCTSLGLRQVATYLQSGNVVFSDDRPPDEIAELLERSLATRFGFAVPVILRTAAEMARIAEQHPFEDRQDDPVKLHVFFLAEIPDAAALERWHPERFAPDETSVDGREIYVHFPNGMGRSRLTVNLGVPATARNWRSVRALGEMARALPAE